MAMVRAATPHVGSVVVTLLQPREESSPARKASVEGLGGRDRRADWAWNRWTSHGGASCKQKPGTPPPGARPGGAGVATWEAPAGRLDFQSRPRWGLLTVHQRRRAGAELRQRRGPDAMEAGGAGGGPRRLDLNCLLLLRWGIVRRRASEPLDHVPEVALADVVDGWLGGLVRRRALIGDCCGGGWLSEVGEKGFEIVGEGGGFPDEGFGDFVGELVGIEVFEGIAFPVAVAGKLSGGGARFRGPRSHFLRRRCRKMKNLFTVLSRFRCRRGRVQRRRKM
ncbi:hypothetical protein CRG98_004193 [Punica granatum]|uniref:Uncharacterized protein n=1 Tax=Punica granatum TaxID=22663 RepID=A0A2I0L3Z4_PUNGR|nr:hypothetical protein CRG98_004193 [Punica granatum]